MTFSLYRLAAFILAISLFLLSPGSVFLLLLPVLLWLPRQPIIPSGPSAPPAGAAYDFRQFRPYCAARC